MPAFKNITALANNPLVGVATTALKPTPAGIAYTGANLISQATTGKTITQHLMDLPKGPATGTGNVGRSRKGKTIREGGYHRDPEQKNQSKMRVGNYSTGGLVTYKGISDLHTKVCGHK